MDINALIESIVQNPMLIAVLVVLIILLIKGQSILSALFTGLLLDGLDFFLSNLDTLFGGGMGLDVGDILAGLIMSIIIYKTVGRKKALFAGFEAINFGLGFIPVIGEVPEQFFGIFPMVTILLILESWKYTTLHKEIKEKLQLIEEPKREQAIAGEEQTEIKEQIEYLKQELKETEKLAKKHKLQEALLKAKNIRMQLDMIGKEELNSEREQVEQEIVRAAAQGALTEEEALRKIQAVRGNQSERSMSESEGRMRSIGSQVRRKEEQKKNQEPSQEERNTA